MVLKKSIACSILAASLCSAAAISDPTYIPADQQAKFLADGQAVHACTEAGYDYHACRSMAFPQPSATVHKRDSPDTWATAQDTLPIATQVAILDMPANDIGPADANGNPTVQVYDGQSQCYNKIPWTNFVSSGDVGTSTINKFCTGAVGKVASLAGQAFAQTAFGKFVDKVKGFMVKGAGPVIKAGGVDMALSLFNYGNGRIPKGITNPTQLLTDLCNTGMQRLTGDPGCVTKDMATHPVHGGVVYWTKDSGKPIFDANGKCTNCIFEMVLEPGNNGAGGKASS